MGCDVVQGAMMQRIGPADMEVCDGLLTQLIGPQNDKKAAGYEIAQPHSRTC